MGRKLEVGGINATIDCGYCMRHRREGKKFFGERILTTDFSDFHGFLTTEGMDFFTTEDTELFTTEDTELFTTEDTELFTTEDTEDTEGRECFLSLLESRVASRRVKGFASCDHVGMGFGALDMGRWVNGDIDGWYVPLVGLVCIF